MTKRLYTNLEVSQPCSCGKIDIADYSYELVDDSKEENLLKTTDFHKL